MRQIANNETDADAVFAAIDRFFEERITARGTWQHEGSTGRTPHLSLAEAILGSITTPMLAVDATTGS